MNLRQRYRVRGKKRLVRFILFYSFLALLLLSYNTLARYTTVIEGNNKVSIANWNIKVNDISIQNEEILSDTIELIPNGTKQTTKDNKLAPGQSGYFDIIVNPEDTEVSIEYTINLDTSKLPNGVVLNNYEIVEEGVSQDIENNTIMGEIILKQTSEKLSKNDTKTVRINWSWNETENDILPTGNGNYKILATISLKQKIS